MGRMRREIITAAEQGQVAEAAAAEVYSLIRDLRMGGIDVELVVSSGTGVEKAIPVKLRIKPKKGEKK